MRFLFVAFLAALPASTQAVDCTDPCADQGNGGSCRNAFDGSTCEFGGGSCSTIGGYTCESGGDESGGDESGGDSSPADSPDNVCIESSILLVDQDDYETLPADTIDVKTQSGSSVEWSVTQTFKNGGISWIAPVMGGVCDEDDKYDEVSAGTELTYTAPCVDGVAEIVVYVHDGSFKDSSQPSNVHSCNGWGNLDGIARYDLKLSCEPDEDVCSGPDPSPSDPSPSDPSPSDPSPSDPSPSDPSPSDPSPSDPSPSGPALPASPGTLPSGSNGDPHFKTWKNEHYEYHGQCDMILVKDPEFAGGLGLEVQIRTKLVRFWSYIKSAAIRLGDDIIEVQGTGDAENAEVNYWYNLEFQGAMETVGGFPVTVSKGVGKSHKHTILIDLDSKFAGHRIKISTFKEFIRVDIENGSEEAFGNSVGLLGDFKTGMTLGRDRLTVLDDFSEFGNEWQVLPSEHMLFHDVAEPQFPKKCIEPEDPQGARRRRLDEESITMEQAEEACGSVTDPLDRKDCVYDILATQDIDMVGAF